MISKTKSPVISTAFFVSSAALLDTLSQASSSHANGTEAAAKSATPLKSTHSTSQEIFLLQPKSSTSTKTSIVFQDNVSGASVLASTADRITATQSSSLTSSCQVTPTSSASPVGPGKVTYFVASLW